MTYTLKFKSINYKWSKSEIFKYQRLPPLGDKDIGICFEQIKKFYRSKQIN